MDNIDYTLVKNLISSIPNEHFAKSADGEASQKGTPQELIDISYDSLLADLATAIDCKCFYSPYTLSTTEVADFLNLGLKTDQLQTNNVLLSSQLWRDVLFSRKVDLANGIFKRSIDTNNLRVNFSEVSATKKNRVLTNPVVTTIQFDFASNPDSTLEPLEITEKTILSFKKLFKRLENYDAVNLIYDLAEKREIFLFINIIYHRGYQQKPPKTLVFF